MNGHSQFEPTDTSSRTYSNDNMNSHQEVNFDDEPHDYPIHNGIETNKIDIVVEGLQISLAPKTRRKVKTKTVGWLHNPVYVENSLQKTSDGDVLLQIDIIEGLQITITPEGQRTVEAKILQRINKPVYTESTTQNAEDCNFLQANCDNVVGRKVRRKRRRYVHTCRITECETCENLISNGRDLTIQYGQKFPQDFLTETYYRENPHTYTPSAEPFLVENTLQSYDGENQRTHVAPQEQFPHGNALHHNYGTYDGGNRYTYAAPEEQFPYENVLHTRRDTHTAENPYTTCAEQFPYENSLSAPYENIGENPYTYASCEEQFSRGNNPMFNYNVPLRKRFSCEICGRQLSSKRNLERHKTRVHTTWKPFKCETCRRMFSHARILERHQATHTAPQEFIHEESGKQLPEECNSTFPYSVHLGKKTFECKMCGRQFTRKSHLTRHWKVHNSPMGNILEI